MNKLYAGIGSRKTPPEILKLMTQVATRLDELGYTLRSGGADGADLAFEQGSKHKEIFLPWKGFNGNNSDLYTIGQNALDIAQTLHPAWDRCSNPVKRLHARNCYQILGSDLNTPVNFVICWHNNSGGTLQAVRLAEQNNIPVINLKDPNALYQIKELL